MKQAYWLSVVCILAMALSCMAQEESPGRASVDDPVPMEWQPPPISVYEEVGGVWTIVAAVLGILSIPLGIASVVKSTNKQRISLPFTTILLGCLGALSLLLGLVGTYQAMGRFFDEVLAVGSGQTLPRLDRSAAQQVFCLRAGVLSALAYLFWFTVSLVIFRRTHKETRTIQT